MAENKEHFWCIIFLFTERQKCLADAKESICCVWWWCQWRFHVIHENSFNLNNASYCERPTHTDSNKILALIESDRHRATQEIGEINGINHSTVSSWLRQLQTRSKNDAWMAYALAEKKKIMDRIYVCDSPLKRDKIDPLLKRMCTYRWWKIYCVIYLKRKKIII